MRIHKNRCCFKAHEYALAGIGRAGIISGHRDLLDLEDIFPRYHPLLDTDMLSKFCSFN